ncbi:MAG TPA: methyl-accepting chemotaxis protein, partial [Blastocatellia bacterium]|nr:methyl-accepting chemotaxis protein [Blastocatellia bacterium]
MNISIAQKLGLLVVAAILGLAGLAYLSQIKLESVYGTTNFANVKSVPSILELDKAITEFGRLRIRIYRHVLFTDTAKMAQIEQTIQTAREALSKALAESEAFINDEKERQMLKADETAMAAYLVTLEEALALSRLNNKQAAADLLTKNAPVAEAFNKALAEHMQYNVDAAKAAADEAAASKTAAVKMSIIIAVAIIALMGVMGFVIARNIKQQLNRAVQLSNSVAAGDLTVDIEVTSKDEIGMLLTALKSMVAKLSSVVNEVRSSADSLSSASEQVSSTAQSMSQATNEQAASVEETSASVEQM